MKKKKTNVAGSRLGYCPFYELESRYNKLYCDTGAQGCAAGATIRPTAPRDGHSTAMGPAIRPTCSQSERRVRARAWLMGVSVTIQKLYLDRGRRQQLYDTACQRARARSDTAWSALRHGAQCAMCGRPGRSARAVCAQARLGCAYCTPDLVLT